jgi:hypothetical protein
MSRVAEKNIDSAKPFSSSLDKPEPVGLPWTFTLILCLGLINFAYSPIGNTNLSFLPILVFAFGTVRYMVAKDGRLYRFRVADGGAGFVILTFLFLIILAQIRTNSFMATTLTILRMVLPSVFLILFSGFAMNQIFRGSDSYKEAATKILFAILFTFSLWAILNVIFYFAFPDFGSINEEGKLMSLFGLPLKKRDFPLVGEGHPNTLGIIIGGIFGMLLLGYFFLDNLPKWGKRFFLLGAASCLFIILAADSRGTFFNALLAPLIIYLLKRFASLRTLLIVIIALPVLQFLMLFLLNTYGDSELLSSFSRGDNDLATGNSRAFIYKYSTRELSDFKETHLYGFGQYGPYEAGVSKHYIHKFGPDISKERKLISSISHNSVFQVIFDTGYIGLVLFLSTLFICIKRTIFLYEAEFEAALCLVLFFLYFALSGISESAMGMYNYGYWLIFVLLTMTTLMFSSNYKRQYGSDLALKPIEKDE